MGNAECKGRGHRHTAMRWQVICLSSMGIFLVLACAAFWGGVFRPERDLMRWMAGEITPGVVAMFQVINLLGDGWVLIPGILLLCAALSPPLRRRWWLWLGVMLAVSILERVAKAAVGRPRPHRIPMGFPSGHTAAAAAFFVMAAYLGQQALGRGRGLAGILTWTLAALLILLVGVARVVLRAYWPLDVVAGAALGVGCAAAAAWWNERMSEPPRYRISKGTGGRTMDAWRNWRRGIPARRDRL